MQMLDVAAIGSRAGRQALGEVCHRLVDTCSCGSSSQMVCKGTFNSLIVSSFDWSLWYFLRAAPQTWVGLSLESLGVISSCQWTQDRSLAANPEWHVPCELGRRLAGRWSLGAGDACNMRSVQAADDQHSSRRWLWPSLPRTAAYSCRPRTLQPTPSDATQTFRVQQTCCQDGRQPFTILTKRGCSIRLRAGLDRCSSRCFAVRVLSRRSSAVGRFGRFFRVSSLMICAGTRRNGLSGRSIFCTTWA